jgi:hypothetical protein
MSTASPENTARPDATSLEARTSPRWAERLAWWQARLAKVFTFPLILFGTSRIAYMGMSFVGMELVPFLFMHEEGRQRVLQPHPWIDGLCRWDCGWFVRIVQQGYANPENAKVFPLLPLLGWSVEKVTGIHHIVVFLLVSNAASLASYYVIYRLFRELEGDDSARWGLMLFASYPFAFFQAAAYSESLMVLATSLSLYLALRPALRGRHFFAATVLGLGVMARHITLIGGLGLVAAQIKDRGWRPKRLLLSPSVLALGIPFIFIALFAWYLKQVNGDALAFWNSRTIGWGPWVWYSVRQVVQSIPYKERPEYYFYMAFVILPTLGAGMLLSKRSWAVVAVEGVAMVALVLLFGGVALGRYSSVAWPAFLPLGVWLSKRPLLQGPLVGLLMAFQGLFFFLFSHQFRIL